MKNISQTLSQTSMGFHFCKRLGLVCSAYKYIQDPLTSQRKSSEHMDYKDREHLMVFTFALRPGELGSTEYSAG